MPFSVLPKKQKKISLLIQNHHDVVKKVMDDVFKNFPLLHDDTFAAKQNFKKPDIIDFLKFGDLLLHNRRKFRIWNK